jgi:hypothetical protein
MPLINCVFRTYFSNQCEIFFKSVIRDWAISYLPWYLFRKNKSKVQWWSLNLRRCVNPVPKLSKWAFKTLNTVLVSLTSYRALTRVDICLITPCLIKWPNHFAKNTHRCVLSRRLRPSLLTPPPWSPPVWFEPPYGHRVGCWHCGPSLAREAVGTPPQEEAAAKTCRCCRQMSP